MKNINDDSYKKLHPSQEQFLKWVRLYTKLDPKDRAKINNGLIEGEYVINGGRAILFNKLRKEHIHEYIKYRK